MGNYDEDYWAERQFEDKYYLQALIFTEFCEPENVIDFGCGKGFFVHAFNYYDVPAIGFDISKFAVEHPYELAKDKLFLLESGTELGKAELVLCYDVLEHINLSDLDKIVENIVNASTNWLIFSICMFGDKNFERDKTHVTKRTREWWINFISKKGVKWVETPKHFILGKQILIFKKGEF